MSSLPAAAAQIDALWQTWCRTDNIWRPNWCRRDRLSQTDGTYSTSCAVNIIAVPIFSGDIIHPARIELVTFSVLG